jgi:hypothetical protein
VFRYADQRLIWKNSPAMHGFINAKKRTNIAGQVAGRAHEGIEGVPLSTGLEGMGGGG